jgi:antitoxin component HigA of HigAB toxin-antitoxin module
MASGDGGSMTRSTSPAENIPSGAASVPGHRSAVPGAATSARLPTPAGNSNSPFATAPLGIRRPSGALCGPISELLGRITPDQADYLEAVRSFIEAHDRERVKWPKGRPAATLKFLLEQHDLSAADLSRVLGSDRSLGPKLLRGERRLTVDHIRTLARHFHIDPGVLM